MNLYEIKAVEIEQEAEALEEEARALRAEASRIRFAHGYEILCDLKKAARNLEK
jgi:hypothetical protein